MLQSKLIWQILNPSWIGVIIGAVLCCLAICLQLQFRREAIAVPAGVAVWPMTFAMAEIGLDAFGLLLGVPFSILGILEARYSRNWIGLWLGVLGVTLSLLPVPISTILRNQTLRSTGIHLTP